MTQTPGGGDADGLQLQLQSVVTRLDLIDTALRGNGRKGLFTEVELLKREVADLASFRNDVKKSRQYSAAAALTVIGQIILTLFSRWIDHV